MSKTTYKQRLQLLPPPKKNQKLKNKPRNLTTKLNQKCRGVEVLVLDAHLQTAPSLVWLTTRALVGKLEVQSSSLQVPLSTHTPGSSNAGCSVGHHTTPTVPLREAIVLFVINKDTRILPGTIHQFRTIKWYDNSTHLIFNWSCRPY